MGLVLLSWKGNHYFSPQVWQKSESSLSGLCAEKPSWQHILIKETVYLGAAAMQLICSSSLFISWVRIFTFTSFLLLLHFWHLPPSPMAHMKTVIKILLGVKF